MTSKRIKKEMNSGICFFTFTVRRWYYLLDGHDSWELLLDSLRYCQKEKGLKIYSWVFMLNHIHVIAGSGDLSGFARDFKKFTSKKLKKNILESEPHLLKLFETDGIYRLWKETNMPIHIENEDFFIQKAKYIEENPVKKRYVSRAEDWYYTSANNNRHLELSKP